MKLNKIVILVFAIAFLAASCSSNSDRLTIPGPEDKVQDNPEINSPKVSPDVLQDEPEMVTVKLKVEGSKQAESNLSVGLGTNALVVLKLAHTVEAKNYEGVGEMVLAIDGVKPDSKHFWAFYVNGKSSNVGASSYKIKNGDNLEWKLEEIKKYE